jgi:hypothetical protein
MEQITLIVQDGQLHYPFGGYDGGASLLIRRYDEGDCDTCPWPMAEDDEYDLLKRLALALYDERETNTHFPHGTTILLPNGERFDFDRFLDEDARDVHQGHQREYNPDNYRGF